MPADAPPSLQPDLPKPTGLNRVVLGVLFFFGILPMAGKIDTVFWPMALLCLGSVGWGVWTFWVRPRRAIEARDKARSAILNDPERMRRIAALRDGSRLLEITGGESVLSVPCTWYVNGKGGPQERDAGRLSVETDRIRLSGESRAQEFRFAILRAIKAKANAVVIERANGPHLTVAVDDPEEVVLAVQLAQRANRA